VTSVESVSNLFVVVRGCKIFNGRDRGIFLNRFQPGEKEHDFQTACRHGSLGCCRTGVFGLRLCSPSPLGQIIVHHEIVLLGDDVYRNNNGAYPIGLRISEALPA